MPIYKTEDLKYATVKINTENVDGSLSSGTGFIVNLAESERDGKYMSVPVIVTNKHVVEGAVKGLVRFHASTREKEIVGQCEYIVDDFEKQFYLHPNEDVDLCAMPIAPLYTLAAKDKIQPYYKSFSMKQVINKEGFQNLTPAQDILAVGYPNGLWDSTNNLPIFRKGIISTVPSIDYMGKEQFLIDCGIYPGSSGSPVFKTEQKINIETGDLFESINLIGIVFATYNHNAQGQMAITKIATNPVNTMVPNHLGLVIKSTRLFELDEIIERAYKDTPVYDTTIAFEK